MACRHPEDIVVEEDIEVASAQADAKGRTNRPPSGRDAEPMLLKPRQPTNSGHGRDPGADAVDRAGTVRARPALSREATRGGRPIDIAAIEAMKR